MQTQLQRRHVGEWKMATKPSRTNLHDLLSNKIWVAGTPGVQGGPRRRSWVRVTDCKDMTLANYINGKLRGNWSKASKNNQDICNNRSDLEIVKMKL